MEGSDCGDGGKRSDGFGDGAATAHMLFQLANRRKAATCVYEESVEKLRHKDDPAASGQPWRPVLSELMNILLNPGLPLNRPEVVDWLKWLMASGRNPEDFYNIVRSYDNSTMCGLVWTANFVAYRCRTCGISPCTSLCAQCFQDGNHEGHDFNMFWSQAGGACDCGNPAVMKESGFCSRHKSNSNRTEPEVPPELLAVTEAIMPRVFLRFIQNCREQSSRLENSHSVPDEACVFLEFLQELSCLGGAMRTAITKSLCSEQLYTSLTEPSVEKSNYDQLLQSKEWYDEAFASLPAMEVPQGYEDISTLTNPLIHKTFLDEIVFWMVRFKFPKKLVFFLLKMRLDSDYEGAFARAFVLHYSRIFSMLESSEESEALSNRVVHVSVQLFSDHNLAYEMTDSFHLLYVMIACLKIMIKKISIPLYPGGDVYRSRHYVVDCNHNVMKQHCYWPMISDLNNILSHKPIAIQFMSDSWLLQEWFSFVSYFQGMNVNIRELHQHVELEPQSYYAAFSAELEAMAYPMWAMISHLLDSETLYLAVGIRKKCLQSVMVWFTGFIKHAENTYRQVSFHIPLHRYYFAFLSHAVSKQGAKLQEMLPPLEVLQLLSINPLQIQVAFYEIFSNMWVRNGLQIKGQAMTYIQCHFSNSMVDIDLFILQICAGELPPVAFLMNILKRFRVLEPLYISQKLVNLGIQDGEHNMTMLESCLSFLATLLTVRTKLGLKEEELTKLEMITLLCMGDKTHSELMEYLPEKATATSPHKDFEAILNEISLYKAPNFEASGTMKQGMYMPQDKVWSKLYDPIYVLLRAVQRKDYQNSLERFKKNCAKTGVIGNCWPPYRIPSPVCSSYNDPLKLTASPAFHGLLFILLYKAAKEPAVSDRMLSLIIFLLELTVQFQMRLQYKGSEVIVAADSPSPKKATDQIRDGQFDQWFVSDDIFVNATVVIDKVNINFLEEEMEYMEEDYEELETVEMKLALTGIPQLLPLPSGSEVVPYREDALSSVTDPDATSTPETPTSDAIPMAWGDGADGTQSSETEKQNSMLVPMTHSSRDGNEVGRSIERMLNRSRPCKGIHRRMRRPAGFSSSMALPCFHPQSSHLGYNNYLSVMSSDSDEEYVQIGESIISLLIKLHSKLYGKPGSYKPNFELNDEDARVGDGVFFIEKVLNKLGRGDSRTRKVILAVLQKFYPHWEEEGSSEEEASARAKEEKKKLSRERQKRVMQEFALRQKEFLENFNFGDEGDKSEGRSDPSAMDVEEEEMRKIHKEYDCVICSQSIPSTSERPVGLIVLLQATSVVGHKTTSMSTVKMPVSDRERTKLGFQRFTLGLHMERRADTFSRYFDLNSWLMSMNIGWEGGVHVQTCGHHLHLDCHSSYMKSLQSSNPSLKVERGEYLCPLCRQLGNSVLPISPEIGDLSAIVRHSSSDVLVEIDTLLCDLTIPKLSTTLKNSMASMMQSMTTATYANYRTVSSNPSTPSLFMFIFSILRTNLEVELVQRGGNLLCQIPNLGNDAKRTCILPLIHVLGLHSKFLSGKGEAQATGVHWIRHTWMTVTQQPPRGSDGALIVQEREVPLLMRDPVAILLQMILFLPAKLDLRYFSCIVESLYKVAVVQAVVYTLKRLKEDQRENTLRVGPLAPLFELVFSSLRDSPLFLDIQPSSISTDGISWTLNDATSEVREICLHFLRIAALLKSHLHEEGLPLISDPLAECGALEQYLGLWESCSVANTAVIEIMCGGYISCSKEVSSPVGIMFGDLMANAHVWCSQIANFASEAQVAASSLLSYVHFFQPRLLTLPHSYDAIFQYYHRRQCTQCHKVPKEPCVCLVCGTLVCLREACCKQQNVCECAKHAIDCGAGTAMFLIINQSTVLVIRGPRACVWGCVHLDSHGEEDRDLKRGRPLFLREERYTLLERQWLMHAFDHTKKNWVWHKDIF